MKNPITPRQQEILNWIHHYQVTERISPSFSDMRTAFNIAQNAIAKHLDALERKGCIERNDRGRILFPKDSISIPSAK